MSRPISHKQEVLKSYPNATVVCYEDMPDYVKKSTDVSSGYAIAANPNGTGLMGRVIWHSTEKKAWRDACRERRQMKKKRNQNNSL